MPYISSSTSQSRYDTNTCLVQLVVPKHHGAKLTDIPDDSLQEILVSTSIRPGFALNLGEGRSTMLMARLLQPVAKKIATAVGAENFNILQNNGRLAHQVVDHVSRAFGARVARNLHALIRLVAFRSTSIWYVDHII